VKNPRDQILNPFETVMPMFTAQCSTLNSRQCA
jgi:hypothetical protein